MDARTSQFCKYVDLDNRCRQQQYGLWSGETRSDPGRMENAMAGRLSQQAATNGAPPQPRKAASMRRDAPPRLGLGVLDGHLGYFLRRAQIAVFQDFIRTLADIDIGPAQYSVLVVIGANDGPSQAEVAATLGIERARLVRMLDHLEQRGLTQRQPSATDRRSHALQLTPSGQKILKRAKALAGLHEARLLARLGAAHHRQLLEGLRGFEL